METPQGPMTVVRLEIDSFKRIAAAEVQPTPTGLVLVRGRNGAGKSSVLDSMATALLGGKEVPDVPISEGAHGARVVVDLGEIVIQETWKRDSGGKAKRSLVVQAKDGVRFNSPQAVLDKLVGHCVDPIAFLSEPPPQQVRMVLGVLGLDRPIEALEGKAQELYDRRRDLGREADRLEKAALELKQTVAELPSEQPSESLDALTQRLRLAQANNGEIEKLRNDRRSVEARGRDLAALVERLQAELADAIERRAQAQQEWTNLSQLIAQRQVVDVAPILEQVRSHEELLRHKAKRELLAAKEAEALRARGVHDATERELLDARAEIDRLLTSASFPVPGMTYDHSAKTLLIGGIPIAQASQGERLRAAAAVAMAGDPPIRVFFIREGSLIDDEGRALLAQIASEKGWQVWMECVDSNPHGVGLWIEDGQVTASDAPAEASV